MFATNPLKNLIKINNSFETLQRFLIPMFLTSCLAALSISQVFEIIPKDSQNIAKIIAALNGIYISMVSLKLYSESHQWQNSKYYLWSLTLSVIVGGIICTQGEIASKFFLAGLFFWITLAPFFKNPALNNDASEVGYCNLNSILLSRALFANIVLALILFICIGSILLSIGYLFDIKISYKIHLSIAIFLIVCVPFYILSIIPKDFTSAEQNHFSGSIKFITSYILLPFSLTYLVILYAYMTKIGIAGTLPKNTIGYLVLIFGIIGIITHFFTRSIYENSGKSMRFFHRYFYHFFLLPIIFLFIAIAIRINQYGITVNRYWALIIAIYLAVSTIYIIFTKAKNLRILAAIISAILILASFGPKSFGPLGANKIAGSSQAKQLETLLIKENILQNGKVVKANQNLSPQTQSRIDNIVNYLQKIQQIDQIKNWLPNNDIRILSNFMATTLAPTKINLNYNTQNQNSNSTRYLAPRNEFGEDIKGYDYIINFNHINSGAPKILTTRDGNKFNMYLIQNKLTITSDKDPTASVEFDLKNLADHLKTSNKKTEDFIIEQSNNKMRAKLSVLDLNIDTYNPYVTLYIIRANLLIKLF